MSEANEVTGFISDGDIMRCLSGQIPAFKTTYSFVVELGNESFDQTIREVASTSVRNVCMHHVISIPLMDDLGAVVQVLAESHVKKSTRR